MVGGVVEREAVQRGPVGPEVRPALQGARGRGDPAARGAHRRGARRGQRAARARRLAAERVPTVGHISWCSYTGFCLNRPIDIIFINMCVHTST